MKESNEEVRQEESSAEYEDECDTDDSNDSIFDAHSSM